MPSDTTTRPPRIALRNLSVLHYANGFTSWHLKPDAVSDVLAPNYFNDACDMIATGDHMHVSAPDGNAILAVESVVGGVRGCEEDVRVNTFTAGPWVHYDDSQDGKTHRHEIVAMGKTICHIYHSVPKQDAANARLIAAAPSLLAALQNCVAFWPSALNDDLQERTWNEANELLETLKLLPHGDDR